MISAGTDEKKAGKLPSPADPEIEAVILKAHESVMDEYAEVFEKLAEGPGTQGPQEP